MLGRLMIGAILVNIFFIEVTTNLVGLRISPCHAPLCRQRRFNALFSVRLFEFHFLRTFLHNKCSLKLNFMSHILSCRSGVALKLDLVMLRESKSSTIDRTLWRILNNLIRPSKISQELLLNLKQQQSLKTLQTLDCNQGNF